MLSLDNAVLTAGTALKCLLAIGIGVALIHLVFGYTRPNIGYHVRNHRDREYTFFIRNLDSVHYRQPLHVVVAGHGLKHVGAQAGPWSRRPPRRLEDGPDDLTRVLVVFDEIPEDAAFAVRVLCGGDAPGIEIAEDSPLQPRSFRKPLARFTLLVKLRYYCLRYLIGVVGFATVFIGGLRLDGQEVSSGEWILVIVAMVIAGVSFALVVPYRGKTTIVGYMTSLEGGQYWEDRTRPSGSLPRSP